MKFLVDVSDISSAEGKGEFKVPGRGRGSVLY